MTLNNSTRFPTDEFIRHARDLTAHGKNDLPTALIIREIPIILTAEALADDERKKLRALKATLQIRAGRAKEAASELAVPLAPGGVDRYATRLQKIYLKALKADGRRAEAKRHLESLMADGIPVGKDKAIEDLMEKGRIDRADAQSPSANRPSKRGVKPFSPASATRR